MNDQLKEEEIKEHCSPRCPRCQGVLRTIEVHGHTQCVVCNMVVEDCCQGSPQKWVTMF